MVIASLRKVSVPPPPTQASTPPRPSRVSSPEEPSSLLGPSVPCSRSAPAPPMTDSMLDRVERHFVYNLLPSEVLCPSVFVARTMWRLGVRPRWSGHGSVRPWDRNEELLVGGIHPDSLARRALNQLRNVKGWSRYVRSVLLAD